MGARLIDKSDPVRVGDNVRHKRFGDWLIVEKITNEGRIAWCTVQEGEQVGWLAVHFVHDLVKIEMPVLRFRRLAEG
jgi:hypothetical protein